VALDWVNFHHLLYFRAVAREGGVVKAARRLHVSPPTVSAQLKQLESQLGAPLFLRTGRSLVLTDLGHTVLRYADGVFDLGEELKAAVRLGEDPQPTRFTVTVAALAPLGIMMGMPFPMGLRVVQHLDQTILPWAWGVNAVTTTLGSVLCVLASMYSGFSLTLLAAAVIYFVGLLSIKPLLTQSVTDKESGEVVAEEVVADAAYSN